MRTMFNKEATEKYGVDEKDGKDTYRSVFNSKQIFNWDYKTMDRADCDSPNKDFLKSLDSMLRPLGVEVVKIKFDGDANLWLVDKIVRKE